MPGAGKYRDAMPSGSTLAAFTAATLVLILLPGPAMLFLIARGVVGGRRVGAMSALGVETATAVYVAATAVGLTAMLAASAMALSAVRYVGAAYLLYLGVRTLASLRTPLGLPASEGAAVDDWASWRQGFLVGISNPKVALFFLAFFPQFIDPAAGSVVLQVVVLGTIFTSIGLVLDVSYGVAGGALGALLSRRPGIARRGKVTAGLAYLGLGGWTAAGARG